MSAVRPSKSVALMPGSSIAGVSTGHCEATEARSRSITPRCPSCAMSVPDMAERAPAESGADLRCQHESSATMRA
eukprot:3940381-Rhodomonas_salina.2